MEAWLVTSALPIGNATSIEELPEGDEAVCRHCERPIREVVLVEKRFAKLLLGSGKRSMVWIHNADDEIECTGLVATPAESEESP